MRKKLPKPGIGIVKLSKNYELTIPKHLREEMGIKPGDQIDFIRDGKHVVMVPVRTARKMEGAFEGLQTNLPRQ